MNKARVMKLCDDFDYPQMPMGSNQLPIIDRDKVAYKTQMVSANVYHIYISDEIVDPFEYIDIVKSINMAGEADQIIFHLNSPGGDIYTAVQIVNAIAMSPATCLAYIEGCCASAATMIALACEGWVMNPLSTFMVHAPTLCGYGKFNEFKASNEYLEKWTKKIFEYCYTGFLTEDEMKQCMDNNKDYWFGYDEFMTRIGGVVEYRKKKIEEMEGKDEACESGCGGNCHCHCEKEKSKKSKAGSGKVKREKLQEVIENIDSKATEEK